MSKLKITTIEGRSKDINYIVINDSTNSIEFYVNEIKIFTLDESKSDLIANNISYTPSGGLTSDNVQGALDELKNIKSYVDDSIENDSAKIEEVFKNTNDSDTTLQYLISKTVNYFTGTLTADRSITLSTTNAKNGSKFHIIRTGGGVFNLNIAHFTGTKSLSTNQWATFHYDGNEWLMTAYGTL